MFFRIFLVKHLLNSNSVLEVNNITVQKVQQFAYISVTHIWRQSSVVISKWNLCSTKIIWQSWLFFKYMVLELSKHYSRVSGRGTPCLVLPPIWSVLPSVHVLEGKRTKSISLKPCVYLSAHSVSASGGQNQEMCLIWFPKSSFLKILLIAMRKCYIKN